MLPLTTKPADLDGRTRCSLLSQSRLITCRSRRGWGGVQAGDDAVQQIMACESQRQRFGLMALPWTSKGWPDETSKPPPPHACLACLTLAPAEASPRGRRRLPFSVKARRARHRTAPDQTYIALSSQPGVRHSCSSSRRCIVSTDDRRGHLSCGGRRDIDGLRDGSLLG